MSALFTPGPWVLSSWDNQRDGWKIVAGGKQIAVSCYLGGTEPSRINGRLIAAAPALYRAAQKHLEWIQKENDGPQYGKLTRDTHPLGEAIWKQWWNEQLDLCAETERLCREALASADTHPKGGDAQQAPSLMGSAVGGAETPQSPPLSQGDE